MEIPDVIQDEAFRRISRADKLVMVASGKGGVGKSLISISLAAILSDIGRKVGLLDLDVHGPSIPELFRTDRLVRATRFGFEPVRLNGMELMSLGYLIGSSPVPLGGEEKSSLLRMMIALTNWSELDYLIVDLPPGTGDEMILAVRALKRHPRSGVILVTLPSRLSLSVVERALTLLRDEGVNILGLVENMSYLKCDGRIVRPFGSSDSSSLGVDVLGNIPLDPKMEEAFILGQVPHKVSEEIRRSFLTIASEVERRL